MMLFDLISTSYKVYDQETSSQVNEHRFGQDLTITNISDYNLYLRGSIYAYGDSSPYPYQIASLSDYVFSSNKAVLISMPGLTTYTSCDGVHDFHFSKGVYLINGKYSLDGYKWYNFDDIEISVPTSSSSYTTGLVLNSYSGNGNPHSHFFNTTLSGNLSFSVSIEDYMITVTCDNYFPGNFYGNDSNISVTISNADNLNQILATDSFELAGGVTPPSGYCTIILRDDYNINSIQIDVQGWATETLADGTAGYTGSYTTTFPYPKKGAKIYIRDAEGNYSQYGILYVKTDNGYIKAKSFNILS